MATEEELGCFLHQQAWLEEAYKHVNNKAQSQATPSSAKGLEVQCAHGATSAACMWVLVFGDVINGQVPESLC